MLTTCIFSAQRDVTYDEAKQFAEENRRWYSITSVLISYQHAFWIEPFSVDSVCPAGFHTEGGAPWDFPPPRKQKTINLILNWLDMQQYKQWRIFIFSSLLTCCHYVATPGLASSARNIVHCLKPNCLGTRPRSSIPLCVRTYYVCERNLSKEEAHGGPGRPGTCNPRTAGTCSAKREGATRAHPEK